jgi:hypothetical protein
MGDGPIKKKTSTPHSLMTTYRMNLISAKSISLDSTFKRSAVTHVCSSSCPSSQYAYPYNYLSVCLPFFLRNLPSTQYKYHESTKDFAKYRPYETECREVKQLLFFEDSVNLTSDPVFCSFFFVGLTIFYFMSVF